MKRKPTAHLILFIGFFLLLINTSCRKVKITETSYPEFIGYWYATEGTAAYIEFDIDEGSGTWAKTEGIVNANATGIPKISARRDILKLSIKKFKIDSYPKKVDGTWTMILDGITYERD